MCRVDDGEGAKVWVTERRVAKKAHGCAECRRTILAGEPYEHHRYVSYDGWCGEHKVCSHCAVLGEWIARECGGTVAGELVEDIEEHASEYKRSDLQALASCARLKWACIAPGASWPGIPVPALPPPLEPLTPTPGRQFNLEQPGLSP